MELTFDLLVRLINDPMNDWAMLKRPTNLKGKRQESKESPRARAASR